MQRLYSVGLLFIFYIVMTFSAYAQRESYTWRVEKIIKTETNGQQYKIEYTYTTNGRIETVKYFTVSNALNITISDFSFNNTGKPISYLVTYNREGGTVNVTIEYDRQGKLVELKKVYNRQTTLFSYSYSRGTIIVTQKKKEVIHG